MPNQDPVLGVMGPPGGIVLYTHPCPKYAHCRVLWPITSRHRPWCVYIHHPYTTQWGFRGTRTSGMMARGMWLDTIHYPLVYVLHHQSNDVYVSLLYTSLILLKWHALHILLKPSLAVGRRWKLVFGNARLHCKQTLWDSNDIISPLPTHITTRSR